MDKDKKIYCPCNWGKDCYKFQQYFQSQHNHPLAGFKKIRYSSSSQKVIQLRSAIERHLKTKLNSLQCYIANHHWPQLLVEEQFIEKNAFPSTLLSSLDAKKYGIVDYCDKYKDVSSKKKNIQFIKAPLVSKEIVNSLCSTIVNDKVSSDKRKRKRLDEIDKVIEMKYKVVPVSVQTDEPANTAIEVKESDELIIKLNGITLLDTDSNKWIDIMRLRWIEKAKCVRTFLDDDIVKISILLFQNVLNSKSVIELDTTNYLTFCMQQYCTNVSIEDKKKSEVRGSVATMCLNCYSIKRQHERKKQRAALSTKKIV